MALLPRLAAATCHSLYPHVEQVTEFTNYMREERGLSPWTIKISRGTIREFLAELVAPICGSTADHPR